MVEATEAIIKATDAEPGDLLMFGADKSEIVAAALGAIRTRRFHFYLRQTSASHLVLHLLL